MVDNSTIFCKGAVRSESVLGLAFVAILVAFKIERSIQSYNPGIVGVPQE